MSRMVSQVPEYPPEAAAERVSRALDVLKNERQPLENVIEAFRGIFVEKARLKAGISLSQEISLEVPDSLRFQQGVPVASWGDLIDFDHTMWMKAADQLIPAMEKGFPKLVDDIQKLKKALEGGDLDPQNYLKAMAGDRTEEMQATASRIDIASGTIEFVLSHIMKPLLEKKAELLKPLIKDLHWQKGYCPICGSMPELAFLKGKEGQRWLRCSLCANEWRFVRLACPFCGNTDHDKLLTYYIADRDQERAEVCQQCKRYVVSIDIRDRSDETLVEVAALGLIHLDVISQQKGFLPAAICAWNIVTADDFSSLSVGTNARNGGD